MKNELRRMLFHGWFLLGVCFLLVLCFFSEIIVTGEHSYTMLQILQDMGRGTITREAVLGTDSILRNAFSGYTSLLVPVVAALPMIRLLYIENRSGYKRFYMSRKSHRKYYWDKWIADLYYVFCRKQSIEIEFGNLQKYILGFFSMVHAL